MKKWMLGLIIFGLILALPVCAEEWQEVNPAVKPPGRLGHAMAGLNGALYVFGGRLASSRGLANDLWKYTEEVWSEETPINDPPQARLGAAMTSVSNKLYLFGGSNVFGEALADVWTYDPVSKEWQQQPSLGDVPPGRNSHTINTLPDGKLVLFGGSNANGNVADDYLRIYTHETGTWVKKIAPRETIGYGHSAVVIDGKLYVFGGYLNFYKNDVWTYDPAQDAWTKLTPQRATLPNPRIYQAMSQHDKSFWIFGGFGSAEFNDNWEFNTTTNVWTKHADLPITIQQAHAGTFVKNDNITHLMFGGKSQGVTITKYYHYLPEANPPQPTEKMVHTQIGALEKGMCSLMLVQFTKNQEKLKVELEWNTADAKLKLNAWGLPWHHYYSHMPEEFWAGMLQMSGARNSRDDFMDTTINQALGATAEELIADRGNKLEVNLTNVGLVLVLVRHGCKSPTAKELQLKIKAFKDNPKSVFYMFPVGTFDKTNTPRLQFVHLPIAPVRWHSHFPHGTQYDEKVEAGELFWEWRVTDRTPRPRWFGYVKFLLP